MADLEMLDYCKKYFELRGGKIFYTRSPSNNVKVGYEVGSIGSHGYREMRCAGRRVLAHQIVWLMVTGEFPSKWIDHKNGDKLDNRFTNLRLCNSHQNQGNRRSKSKYKGVSRGKGDKWRARIGYKNKQIHIGTFDTPHEAARAYDEKASELFKGFARLNFGVEIV